MLKDMKIKNFMEMLSSKAATPGGGSVAALTGAMGAALLSMVGNLTVGKEQYKEVEDDIKDLLKKSESLRATLQELMEKDVEVFNQFMAIMKLPRPMKRRRKTEIRRCRVP